MARGVLGGAPAASCRGIAAALAAASAAAPAPASGAGPGPSVAGAARPVDLHPHVRGLALGDIRTHSHLSTAQEEVGGKTTTMLC